MILMIDNFDSFTYNLVQYLKQLGGTGAVVRNNAASLQDITAMKPAGIVISPGPGRPESAGISIPIIKYFSGKIPVLGVCLGHQAIATVFGGSVVSAKTLMHGKVSQVTSDGKSIYKGIPNPFNAMRYHSLAVSRVNFPASLEISSESEDGEIMGIRHRGHQTEGVQFHPESIMTSVGKRILRNFLNGIKSN
jgi:anthranilate synthase component 2